MSKDWSIVLVLCVLFLAACGETPHVVFGPGNSDGDSLVPDGSDIEGGPMNGSGFFDPGDPTAGPANDLEPGSDSGRIWDEAQTLRFRIALSNISEDTAFAGAISDGVWVVFDGENPVFEPGMAASPELEILAEEGDPRPLETALLMRDGVIAAGTFSGDRENPNAIEAGETQEVVFELLREHEDAELVIAARYADGNDAFVANYEGVPLFTSTGAPNRTQFEDALDLWDAGTEINEAPGHGPSQIPYAGSPESAVIRPFEDSTRALPQAAAIVRFEVGGAAPPSDADDEATDGPNGNSDNGSDDGWTIAIVNVTDGPNERSAVTSLSGLIWLTHAPDFQLFEEGRQASDPLERLIEDGDVDDLVRWLREQPNVGQVGVLHGPIYPGDRVEFFPTASPSFSQLSYAAMITESNDAFVAPGPAGIDLLAGGTPRPSEALELDLNRNTRVWDGGTEVNEVPGIGPSQPHRATNDGGGEPEEPVRPYADRTNDLADLTDRGLATLTLTPTEVESGSDAPVSIRFDMDLQLSEDFPYALGDLLVVTHDVGVRLFEVGGTASEPLEYLVETGDPRLLAERLRVDRGFGSVAILEPSGDGHRFACADCIEIAPGHLVLNLLAMIQPSNDTFLALGDDGVLLADVLAGEVILRPQDRVVAEAAASLAAYDAGTERNQAAAIGPDQAPRRRGIDDGFEELPETAVDLLADPIWVYPSVVEMITATLDHF